MLLDVVDVSTEAAFLVEKVDRILGLNVLGKFSFIEFTLLCLDHAFGDEQPSNHIVVHILDIVHKLFNFDCLASETRLRFFFLLLFLITDIFVSRHPS